MKAFIQLSVVLLLSTISAKAQTWEEIFDQKNTQIKYLTQQIIALNVQIGHIQKGYRVVKEGLDFIGKATKGELGLHDVFFKSLRAINPEVNNYPQVDQVALLGQAVQHKQRQYISRLNETDMLSQEEMQYVVKVFGRISEDGEALMKELQQVLAPDKLGMQDDERIERINVLYERMRENYLITARFGDEAVRLALSRLAEKADLDNSKTINQPNK